MMLRPVYRYSATATPTYVRFVTLARYYTVDTIAVPRGRKGG
eukprot:COSAG05_NODE_10600_length_556_cov_1.004376_1_plen_42_part_00